MNFKDKKFLENLINRYSKNNLSRNIKYPLIDNLSGEHNIGTKKLKSNVAIKVKTITLDKYVSINQFFF